MNDPREDKTRPMPALPQAETPTPTRAFAALTRLTQGDGQRALKVVQDAMRRRELELLQLRSEKEADRLRIVQLSEEVDDLRSQNAYLRQQRALDAKKRASSADSSVLTPAHITVGRASPLDLAPVPRTVLAVCLVALAIAAVLLYLLLYR